MSAILILVAEPALRRTEYRDHLGNAGLELAEPSPRPDAQGPDKVLRDEVTTRFDLGSTWVRPAAYNYYN